MLLCQLHLLIFLNFNLVGEDKKMTGYYISNFREFLHNVKNSSKNTIESYSRDIESFFKFLNDNDLEADNVSKDDIENYINELTEQGKTQSTIIRTIASIRCFYQYLIYDQKVNDNPTSGIKFNKIQKKLPEILSPKEVDTLLAQPNISTLRGCRDKGMLELMYATGIRVSELINLNIEDINFQINILHCKTNKNERIIPIYKGAIKAVEAYLLRVRPVIATNRNQKALFLNLNGGRITRQGFWKIVKAYAEDAGIKKTITPHTIRHSFAAHLLDNGAGIKDIKDMLGHSGISSTQIYAQIVKQKYDSLYKKYHPKAGV